MLKELCLDSDNFEINSEEILLDIFNALINKGLEPFDAYDLIVEKFGKDIISEILLINDDNLQLVSTLG